jgi:hypothetical protein
MPSVGASKLMRLLFRMIFWLTLVLVLLPSVGSQTTSSGLVSGCRAASAAKATVTDLRSFCQRQPEACTVGSQAAALIGHRAQAGAKMLYEYSRSTLARRERDPGKCRKWQLPGADRRPSWPGYPLPADLAPAWRGPRQGSSSRSVIDSPLALDLREASRRNRQSIRARAGLRPRELFLSETAVSPYIWSGSEAAISGAWAASAHRAA